MKIIKNIFLSVGAVLFVACSEDDYTGEVFNNNKPSLWLLPKRLPWQET